MSDTPPSIQIRLFGPPEFRVDGAPLPRLKTRKGLHVLALLTLRHGREVARDWLAGTLWPDTDERLALAYLRQSLTDLRRALGPGAAGRLVSPSSRTLRFDVDGAAVDADVVTFERCLKRGDAAALKQAVALYRGPLLEGWAVEWLLGEREAREQAYLGALETLARQALEGEGGEGAPAAVRYLRLVVAADPLRESACRALLEALAATRDYAAVTGAYRDLRLALRREVNAEPDAETQALFARLRADARGQAAAVRAGGAKGESRTRDGGDSRPAARGGGVSLPRPLSEFIGRGREVEAARGALLASARLVTLTGIGGVGKTRLAVRVAEEAADDFPDGVFFVDLSPVADPDLVAKAAGQALGVAEQPRRPPDETIAEHLGERHLLLVLDNCEHLPEACARFAAALLGQCPNVRILATSRQSLHVTGETVLPVPPLTLPDLKRWREDDKNAAAALLEYEAVRLFVDRAQRVRAGLTLDSRTLLAIAAVCERLDGIPLALELAAARMSVLGPEQIVARLGERLRLLSGRGGDPTAPDRQRTLRAALDWSYDLLPPEGRMLLRRASVFAGGWTLEAAEAVCCAGETACGGGGGLEEWGVLDCLASLADQSLVVVEPENGGTRYRLLETVREYGRERLREQDADEAARLRARHRDYFLRLAREAVPNLGGPEQSAWLDHLEAEHDNLRAVLDGCLEEGTAGAVRTGLGLAGELQQFWMKRGHAGEGRARYAALLAADAGAQQPSPERARALEGAGTLAYRQGDYAAAREALEEALAIHRHREDAGAEATPLALLGSIAYVQGDYSGARAFLERALTLRRAAGHRPGEASVLNSTGHVAVEQGAFEEAHALYTQALAISREVGDGALEASCLNSLGRLADFQNDFAGARPWFEQALARNREIGDSAQVVINLYNLGENSQKLGDPETAEDYFRQSLLVSRELGESRSRRLIAFLLKGLAMTALAHTQPERAALLLGASDALREAIGVPLNADDREEYDHFVADLRGALGEARYAAKRAEGAALRTDQAVAVALYP